MKNSRSPYITIGASLFSAGAIFLITSYFNTFVTEAAFNEFKIQDKGLKSSLSTKLEIIIKNQDYIKERLKKHLEKCL